MSSQSSAQAEPEERDKLAKREDGGPHGEGAMGVGMEMALMYRGGS